VIPLSTALLAGLGRADARADEITGVEVDSRCVRRRPERVEVDFSRRRGDEDELPGGGLLINDAEALLKVPAA
jgi:hypothetical protein